MRPSLVAGDFGPVRTALDSSRQNCIVPMKKGKIECQTSETVALLWILQAATHFPPSQEQQLEAEKSRFLASAAA